MSVRRRAVPALLWASVVALGAAPQARADSLEPDEIFLRAKGAWHARIEVPFVTFALRERYVWRGRVHDNWWQASYRDTDRTLALRRVVTPAQEEARLRGMPINLNLRLHGGAARADSLDTNADADAFPILDPMVEPDASFGLLAHETRARLSGESRFAPSSLASPSPPAGGPDSAAGSVAAASSALRELAHVEAVARDYSIALVGPETLHDVETYHLTLTPLRDPRVCRLRDVWVDASTFRTVALAVQGLFDGKPYEDARWLVSYVEFDGRNYVQQIRTDDTLKFGLDRFVNGLQFDFVQYAFPDSIPYQTFQRLL